MESIEQIGDTAYTGGASTLSTQPAPGDGSVVASASVASWGWLAALSLVSSIGLLLVAIANSLSRSGAGQYEVLFWIGLLTVIIPTTARLASGVPSRHERLGLVVLVGLGLYLVKIIHSPTAFTFSDELIHLYNGNQILQTGRLFASNPILPVTPLYPGLETVTAAVVSLSGLSVFGAGLIVVGIARLVLMLALYFFYEQVSDSPQLAGVAAVLYAANANFLFWSAQFSYESVALPLTMLVLFAAARRVDVQRAAQSKSLRLIALVGIAAVVVTHHLSSYLLAAFLIGWAFVVRFRVHLLFIDAAQALIKWYAGEPSVRPSPHPPVLGRAWRTRLGTKAHGSDRSGPGDLALFAFIASMAWLIFVASSTVDYLSPVLGGAVTSILRVISGEEGARELFRSSGGYVAPLWERLVAIGSILLMLVGLLVGLRQAWPRFRQHSLAVMLSAMAVLYFGVLTLRFSPAAWETGNRASQFLFIGLSFVLAFAVVDVWHVRRAPGLSRFIILGSVAIIFAGGVISGWPPQLRLGQPLQVAVDQIVIEPQGMAAAHWVRTILGSGNRLIVDESNARLMLAYGEQIAIAGRNASAKEILGTPEIPDWQVGVLQDRRVQYIVVDRRTISWDNMAGYYFDRTTNGQLPSTDLFDPTVYRKFDKPQGISRVFDSGNLVIYDVRAISNATTVK